MLISTTGPPSLQISDIGSPLATDTLKTVAPQPRIERPTNTISRIPSANQDNIESAKLLGSLIGGLSEAASELTWLKREEERLNKKVLKVQEQFDKGKSQHQKYPSIYQIQSSAVLSAQKELQLISEKVKIKGLAFEKRALKSAQHTLPAIIDYAQNAKSNTKLDSLEQSVTLLLKERDDQNRRIQELQTKLQANVERESKDTEATGDLITQFNQRLDVQQKRVQEATETAKTTRSELEKFITRNDFQELEGQVTVANATIENVSKSINDLKTEVFEIKGDATSQGNQMDDIHGALTQKGSKFDEMSVTLTQYGTRFEAVDKILDTVKADTDNLKTKLDNVDIRVTNQASGIDSVNDMLTQHSTKFDGIETDIAKLSDLGQVATYSNTKSTATAPKEEFSELSAKVISVESTIEIHESKLKNLGLRTSDVQEIRGAVKDLRDFKSAIEVSILPAMDRRVGDAEEQLKRLRRRLDKANNKSTTTSPSPAPAPVTLTPIARNSVANSRDSPRPVDASFLSKISTLERKVQSLEDGQGSLLETAGAFVEETLEQMKSQVNGLDTAIMELSGKSDSMDNRLNAIANDAAIMRQAAENDRANLPAFILSHTATRTANLLVPLKADLEAVSHSQDNLQQRVNNINTQEMAQSMMHQFGTVYPHLANASDLQNSLQGFHNSLQNFRMDLNMLSETVNRNKNAAAPTASVDRVDSPFGNLDAHLIRDVTGSVQDLQDRVNIVENDLIVAQKKADNAEAKAIALAADINAAKEKADTALTKANGAEGKANSAEIKASDAQAKADNLFNDVDENSETWATKLNELYDKLDGVYSAIEKLKKVSKYGQAQASAQAPPSAEARPSAAQTSVAQTSAAQISTKPATPASILPPARPMSTSAILPPRSVSRASGSNGKQTPRQETPVSAFERVRQNSNSSGQSHRDAPIRPRHSSITSSSASSECPSSSKKRKHGSLSSSTLKLAVNGGGSSAKKGSSLRESSMHKGPARKRTKKNPFEDDSTEDPDFVDDDIPLQRAGDNDEDYEDE